MLLSERMYVRACSHSYSLLTLCLVFFPQQLQLVKLKGKQNILEWRALASKRSMFNLDPVVVEVRPL